MYIIRFLGCYSYDWHQSSLFLTVLFIISTSMRVGCISLSELLVLAKAPQNHKPTHWSHSRSPWISNITWGWLFEPGVKAGEKAVKESLVDAFLICSKIGSWLSDWIANMFLMIYWLHAIINFFIFHFKPQHFIHGHLSLHDPFPEIVTVMYQHNTGKNIMLVCYGQKSASVHFYFSSLK